MNQYQKEQVLALRGSGETCANIAESLGLSVNTVKSFCRRNSAGNREAAKIKTAVTTDGGECPQCGNKIKRISGRKPKRFCSDECRVLWWNSHTGNVNQKALYSFKCAHCGKDFTAYGNAKRRYCSHSCYCADRFEGKAAKV
jgi:endogenous inhibitor of DNA gyrase (YacG/DUF329 family)